jgi:hypothetical protein
VGFERTNEGGVGVRTLESRLERELEELLRPRNFFSLCSPHDPTAVRSTRIRREDHQMWQAELPDELEDVELVLAGLRASTGHGDQYLQSALYAHMRLRELPRLKALQERMFHLDLGRLKAIDAVLCKLDADNLEQMAVVDKEITDFLTPTRPNQALPTAHTIREKLNAIIQSLDESVSTDDTPPKKEGHFSVHIDGDRGFIEVITDAVTAHEINERVRKHATANDLSFPEAFHQLVRGEAATDITLNVYRAKDVSGAPSWISGIGWTSPGTAEQLIGISTEMRDMDEIYRRVSEAYATPADIRAAVIGWDGACSYPGCSRPGVRTQMDHRVDWADGGQTTAANLVTLCQKHHNIKTDGRVHYIIDPHTREKYWLFEDGRWIVEEPVGPLAPKQRHWVQTVEQRTGRRRERIRAESRARREQEKANAPPGD